MQPANEHEIPLPKSLPGAVCAHYVKVAGKIYGPYWFRFWRVKGKLKKEYVPKESLGLVIQACEAHRFEKQSRRQLRDEYEDLLRDARSLLRSTQI